MIFTYEFKDVRIHNESFDGTLVLEIDNKTQWTTFHAYLSPLEYVASWAHVDNQSIAVPRLTEVTVRNSPYFFTKHSSRVDPGIEIPNFAEVSFARDLYKAFIEKLRRSD